MLRFSLPLILFLFIFYFDVIDGSKVETNTIVKNQSDRSRKTKMVYNDLQEVINSYLGCSTDMINASAVFMNDYIFSDFCVMLRTCFHLPKIPVFTLIPTLTSTGFSPLNLKLTFGFKVKTIHLVSFREGESRSYNPEPIYSWDKFRSVDVVVRCSKNGFVDAKIANFTNMFQNIDNSEVNVEITFDQIFQRVIFQQKDSTGEVRFVIFDLFGKTDNIQLVVKNLTRKEKLLFKLKPLNLDKNREDFNPQGLWFSKVPVPGELQEQKIKKLILTQNFNPQELNFKNNIFLQPLSCPTNENPFELKLTFQMASVSDRFGNSLSIPPGFNTCVATVVCDREAKWRFKNTPFRDAEKIYFDLQNEKAWIISHEQNMEFIKFNLTLKKDSKPTLELKNLTHDQVAKISFTENKNNTSFQDVNLYVDLKI